MTSSGEHAIEQCIQEAFGQDGGLAQVFLQAFRSTFVEPLNTKLNELTFRNLIKRKNPYLYHASGLTTIEELVERAFNDFVSSSTEGRFGKFLELLAVSLPGNIKSSAAGVDIERRYPDHVELFAVKSGPAGYNSSSWQTQQGQLSAARTRLQQGGHNTIAYTGPAYGRKRTTVDKRHGIVRLSSRDLWHRLSGDELFYQRLLNACECVSQLYQADLERARSRLQDEARRGFAFEDGRINWGEILRSASG